MGKLVMVPLKTEIVCARNTLVMNSFFFLRLQHQVKRHNLIVASYDVVRNDIDFFR